MNKLPKILAVSLCMMFLPHISMCETKTFTASKDIGIQKGYQNSQLLYIVPKGTVMNLKSTNGNWHNVSYEVDGEEVIGWVSQEQPQVVASPTATNVPQGGGLTLEQQAYLRDYTYTYVNLINSKGLYKYTTSHPQNDNSYNLKLTNGIMWHCCSAFCGSMLHQTVGAPFNGETVDGRTYKKTGYYGTGFANPNGRGKEVFFNIGASAYLEPGDVLTCAGYGTHAVLYLGYNSKTGYHEVAESGSKLRLTKLVAGTRVDGEKMTLAQLRSRTVYKEASRIKYTVLPKNWTMPSSVVINIKNG